MDCLQHADRHVGVELGSVRVFVAEHRLHVAQIGAVLQHGGRQGVAEHMAGAVLADVGLVDVPGDHPGDPALVEALAFAG